MTDIPPLRAHDYYGRDPKLRMAKADLDSESRRRVRSTRQSHRPSTRAPEASSSSLETYVPWRDEPARFDRR
jgi:hypothetical protein